MIPGITASAAIVPPPALDLYAGATVILDFENSVYRIAGVDTPVASILSDVSQISGGRLNLVNLDPVGPIALSNDAVTAINFSAGISLYCDMNQSDFADISYAATIMSAESEIGDYSTYGAWQLYSANRISSYLFNYYPTYEEAERAFTIAEIEGMRRKVMASVNSSVMGVSCNGAQGSTSLDVTFPLPTPTHWNIGAWQEDTEQYITASIRKIIIYPFKSLDQLDIYTAI